MIKTGKFITCPKCGYRWELSNPFLAIKQYIESLDKKGEKELANKIRESIKASVSNE